MRTADTAESPEDMPLPAAVGELDDDAGADGPDDDAGDRHPDRSDASRRRPARRSGRRNHGRRGRRRAWEGFTDEQLAARAAGVPALVYPDELPVSTRRDEIAEAIRDNQVVIVAGETGSGKTTQLPKICLGLGRGVTGMIGHTQPRRIAARSVAERIAGELGTPIGRNGVVGYQVRFTEETGPATLVKLMTDGILLAEIQSDPMLRRYDTIIVDEAHERSLTIDFILGYLARLLPARPDLKVIITSATIDSERFADHFGRTADPDAGSDGVTGGNGSPGARVPAPVIEVSGRTYPVEVRYRPLLADDAEPAQAPPAHAPGGEGPSPAPPTGPAPAGELTDAELEALTSPDPAVRAAARARRPATARVRGGLGGPLGQEPQPPARLQGHGGDPAAGDRQRRRRAQGGGQDGADHEGRLVQGRLQGEGRVDVVGRFQQRRPARAHQRAHGPRQRAGQGGQRDERPRRRAVLGGRGQGEQRGAGGDQGRRHDPRLPVGVDQAGQEGRADGGRDDIGGADRPGRRVGAVQVLDRQDGGDAHHGHGEAGQEPRGGEAQGPRPAQNAAVGGGHMRFSRSPLSGPW